MKLKRVIAIACTAAMTASLISGCGGSSDEGQKEAVKEAEGTAKEDLPLAKYPETVTVHLGGKMNRMRRSRKECRLKTTPIQDC